MSPIFSVLRLLQFVLFIVGDKCDLINQILAAYFDHDLHGDDKCFDVKATLQSGCWLLFGATVFLIASRNAIMYARSHTCMRIG